MTGGLGRGSRFGRCSGCGSRSRGGCSGNRGLVVLLGHGRLLAVAAYPYRFFAFVNLQLVDTGFIKQFDEFLYFADIH